MEQGVFAHSTVMPDGQDVEQNQTDDVALNAAATKLLTKREKPMSVAEAIDAHRAAREALGRVCSAADKIEVEQNGGDASDEAMAPAMAVRDAADDAELDALSELLAVRPSDPADLSRIIRYLAGSHVLDDIYPEREGMRNLAEMAETVVAFHHASSPDAAVIVLATDFFHAYAASRKAEIDLDADRITEEQRGAAYDRMMDLMHQVGDATVSSVAGMAYKCLVLGASEADDLGTRSDPTQDNEWQKIGRQFEKMILAGGQADLAPTPLGVVDPIFPLIEEGRRLLAASETLHARPEAGTAEGEALAEGERTDALQALWDHVDNRLLKTVPLTAAGCRELSRFAVEYFQRNEVPISDDEQAVPGLIARSPLLDLGSKQAQPFASVAPGLEGSQSAASPADLADACDWAVRHSAWLNEASIAEDWSNERVDEEVEKYDAVWDRAIAEPADTIQVLAAKARLFKTSWLEHNGDAEFDSLDKMILSVMEDVAALNSSESPSSSKIGAGSPQEGKRLGLTDEVLILSGHITDAVRFASIARIVRDDALDQVDHKTENETHAAYMLLRSQVNDLVFIIDQTADAAEAADKAMTAVEALFVKHCVVRDIQGSAA